MNDLLKEAIADAKALRATALENAKIALEEAFTPRLKNMLSQKIQSEEMPDNEEYGEGEGEVGSGDGHMEAEATILKTISSFKKLAEANKVDKETLS